MSIRKMTPWFPSDVKPAYIGVYQTINADKADKTDTYQRWNGRFWENMAMHPSQCNVRTASVNDKPRWRGLTEPADAAQ